MFLMLSKTIFITVLQNDLSMRLLQNVETVQLKIIVTITLHDLFELVVSHQIFIHMSFSYR